jgi:hypothetical protein
MYFVSFLYKVASYEGHKPVAYLGKCWFECVPDDDEEITIVLQDILFEGLVLCKPEMNIDFDPTQIKKTDISLELISFGEREIKKGEQQCYHFFYAENYLNKKKFYYRGKLLL